MADLVLSPDYRSQSFHQIYDKLSADPDLSPEEKREFIRGYNIDPKDFGKQLQLYGEALDKGEDIRTFSEAGTSGATVGRTVGRFAGESLGFLDTLIGDGLGLVSNDAEEWWTNLGQDSRLNDIIGIETIRDINAALDPYHDTNTIQGAAEEGIGTLASYFTGAGIIKGARGGITLGAKSLNPKLTKANKAVPIQKVSPVKNSFGKKLKKNALTGFDFAVASTFIDDPEENAVNMLTDMFPETLDFLEAYRVNPEDPEMRQKFDAFLNNLILFEGATVLLQPFLTGAGKVSIDAFAKGANKISRMAPDNVRIAAKDLGKFAARNFTSKQGIFDEGFRALSRRDKRKAKFIKEIEQANTALLTAIKREGRGQNKKEIDRLLNQYLGGTPGEKAAAILELQNMNMTKTVDIIQKMRGDIDGLSQGIRKYLRPKGGSKPEDSLQAIFEANDGIYLNRAYRTFDDPNWKGLKSLRKELGEQKADRIINNVKAHLRGNVKFKKMNPDMNEEGLQNYVDNLALGFKGQPGAFSRFMNDVYGAGSSNIAKKRKEIPPEIRELWGEYKDPFKNYARTMEKMSSVQVELDFLEEMSKALRNRGYTQAVKNAAKKVGIQNLDEKNVKTLLDRDRKLLDIGEDLGAAGQKRLEGIVGKEAAASFDGNPLKGLFGDVNYKKAIETGLDFNFRTDNPLGLLLRTWMKIKAGTQVSQTVLSPTVHGRNIVGNGIMMLANGYMLPVAGKGTKKFFEDVSNKIFKMNDKEINKYSNRLLELGITESAVKASIIKQTAGEAFKKGPASIFDKGFKRVGKKIAKIPFDMYQAEDDYFKILHFEKSLGLMKRAYPELAQRAKNMNIPKADRDSALRELEERAAERTRARMPNYGEVPRALKALRAAPLGDFAAFPWETMRTSKNLLVGSIKDIRSGNPELKKAGYKTLGGMVSVGVMGDMLSDYSAQVMNISPEQRDAADNLGARWEYNIPKIFISDINKDKNNRLGFNYLNLGPIDPYEYFKPIARTAIKVLTGGDDLTDEDINRAIMANVDRTFGPYVGTSMLTNAIMEVASGKDTREGDDVGTIAEKVVTGLLEPLTPGFVKFMQRRSQYEKSDEAARRRGYGEAESKYGYTMSEGQQDWLALTGFAPQRFDISANFRRDMLGHNRSNQDAAARFRGIEQALGTTDPGTFGFAEEQTAAKLFEDFKDVQRKRLTAQKKLHGDLEDYRVLGLNETDGYFTDKNITDALSRADARGKSREVPSALLELIQRVENNRFTPYLLPDNLVKTARKLLGIDIPVSEMSDLQRQLYDSRIFEFSETEEIEE